MTGQPASLSHVHTCYTAVQTTVSSHYIPLGTFTVFKSLEIWVFDLPRLPILILQFSLSWLVPTNRDQTTKLTIRSVQHIIPFSFKYCLLLCDVSDCTPQSSNSGVQQCIVLLSKRTFTLLHIASHYLVFLLPVREFLKFLKPNKRFTLNIDSDIRDGFLSRISELNCIWVHFRSKDVAKY